MDKKTRKNPTEGLTIELLTEYANQGYSINQTARILNQNSDAGIRLFLKFQPNSEILLAQFKANGLKRKYQGRRT